MGFVIAVPIEDLTHIPPEYFDDLPYGACPRNALFSDFCAVSY
jgi:hypothetical protein